MAQIDGDDVAYGELVTYEEMNRVKNNFRGASAPANIQPGMIFSDDDDDKLYHALGTSGTPLEEVLQETKSADKSPIFDDLYLTLHLASVSDPPTQAELESEFGAAPAAGFQALLKNTLSGSGKVYRIVNDGTYYYQLEYTKAT